MIAALMSASLSRDMVALSATKVVKLVVWAAQEIINSCSLPCVLQADGLPPLQIYPKGLELPSGWLDCPPIGHRIEQLHVVPAKVPIPGAPWTVLRASKHQPSTHDMLFSICVELFAICLIVWAAIWLQSGCAICAGATREAIWADPYRGAAFLTREAHPPAACKRP